MPTSIPDLDALAEGLGLGAQQLWRLVRADVEWAQRERAKNAAYMRQYRKAYRKPYVRVTVSDREERKKDVPSFVLSNESTSEGTTRARANFFDQFWEIYPNKVGKSYAKKCFQHALKRIDFEILMIGLNRYIAKTDDRQWCNPSTWLNQDRWEDQPTIVKPNGGQRGKAETTRWRGAEVT